MGHGRQGPRSGAGEEHAPRLAGRLRTARETKGASLEAASRETGVPLRYLQMFEEGRYPMVSDPAYLAPFLRRYAGHLGLDSEEALREFIAETEPEASRARERPRARFIPPDTPPPRRARRWIGYAAATAVTVAALGVGYVALARRNPGHEAPAITQARMGRRADVETATPIPRAGDAAKTDPIPHEPSRRAPLVAEKLVPTAPPQTVPSPLPTRAPPPSPTPVGSQGLSPPYELRLTATSRAVWIWVSIDGGPRRSVQLNPGQNVKWVAQRGYVLSVDDAGAVWAVLNGTALGVLGADAQVRRNLVIPSPSRIKEGAG